MRGGAVGLLALVLLQIYLGALVAGLRAGLISDTWPLIDGRVVPEASRLWFLDPPWRNLFENALTVQFNHRLAGYLLLLWAWLHAAAALWTGREGAARTGALALATTVTLQAALGVLTILHQVPLLLALAHQAMAIVVLTVAVMHVERLGRAARVQTRAPAALASSPRA
jgi:cytochrome c oxidase assembly protein subunit 15